MQKFILGIILLISTSFITIIGQDNDKYLISIPTDNISELNSGSLGQISIYHIFDEALIAGADSKDLTLLNQQNISFEIFDESPNTNEYYILSNKYKENINLSSFSNSVIYKSGNSAIIKNNPPANEEILNAGLNIARMEIIPDLLSKLNSYKINASADLDSVITSLITQVNPDTIEYYIQSLEDFNTRYCLAPNRDEVADWIKNEFLKMGYTEVTIDSFQYQGTWQKNIIATLPANSPTEEMIVVGGHHDSYAFGTYATNAPGAVDNASGTAGVLEMARILRESNYQPEVNFKFITFAAEELGLHGSRDYAQKANAADDKIKLMINFDMISYTTSPVQNSMVEINHYSGSEGYRDLALNNIQNYTAIGASIGALNASYSDSYSFWTNGFDAIYIEEPYPYSPIHTPNDSISNCNFEYEAEILKGSIATLISASVKPANVVNFKVADEGSGSELYLSWSANNDFDFSEYKIYVGNSSGNYTNEYTTTDTSFTVNNLVEGTLYYIGISALDVDNNESAIIEKSGTPYLLPLPLASFSAEPLWQQIKLLWNSNFENDLLGYNIYRSTEEQGTYAKLNNSVYTDTVFIDATPQAGVYYYYIVKSIDDDLNESINNLTIRSRAVTMNLGILLVDETADGDGSLLNPTDADVDNFYHSILPDYTITDHDIIAKDGIDLADLGAYSTIIWHGDDLADQSTAYEIQNDIKKYLDFGGQLFYSGYKPTKAFQNSLSSVAQFSTGDFIYDYLKIESVERKLGAKFIGAQNMEPGYSSIYTDSLKTELSDNFHLKNIESISSAPAGTNIYIYDTEYDTTSMQGSMFGMPVGVEYMGQDYKSVILSFPLYFMDQNEAKSLIDFVLTTKFSELTGTTEITSEIPTDFRLSQNYPNPFNPATIINYSVPVKENVSLKIFDILGNEIAVLVNEQKSPGRYEIEFNGNELSSGIYFYQLKTSSFVETKKMMLIK